MNPVFDGKVKQPQRDYSAKHSIITWFSAWRVSGGEKPAKIVNTLALSGFYLSEKFKKIDYQAFCAKLQRHDQTNKRKDQYFKFRKFFSSFVLWVSSADCWMPYKHSNRPLPAADCHRPPGGVVDDSLNYRSDGDEAFAYIIWIAVYLDNIEAVNERKSRRKQLAIKNLICQNRRSRRLMIGVFGEKPAYRSTADESGEDEEQNRRQRSDRFAVITFSLSDLAINLTLRNFISAKAFHSPSK